MEIERTIIYSSGPPENFKDIYVFTEYVFDESKHGHDDKI